MKPPFPQSWHDLLDGSTTVDLGSSSFIRLIILIGRAALFLSNRYLNSKRLKAYSQSTTTMQVTNTALFFLAATGSLVAASPAGRAGVVKRQANAAANDGAKGVLAAQKAELAKALEDAGIAGAITTGAKAQSILAELEASLGITLNPATATAGAQATAASAGGQGQGQAQATGQAGGAQAGAAGASGEAKATGAAGNSQSAGAAGAQPTGAAGENGKGKGSGKSNGNGNANGNGNGNGDGNGKSATENQAQQNADAVAKLSAANVAAQASQSAAIVAAQQGSPAGLR
ncbi:hypothetical protein F5883DRAFT_612632 [Diaporthe sp. PMI_573]|nr:hypothetical protein F5883DRAFT_612632 [Diaporthaceae sp. PMI_573]